MSILDQIQTALHTADNMIQDGKINVTVDNPVVQVSAEQALAVGKPYIIAVVVMVGIALLLMLSRRGVA